MKNLYYKDTENSRIESEFFTKMWSWPALKNAVDNADDYGVLEVIVAGVLVEHFNTEGLDLDYLTEKICASLISYFRIERMDNGVIRELMQ